MTRSALRDAALAVVAVLAGLRGTAAAQACGGVPVFDDSKCDHRDGSIDGFKDCYRDLYDDTVIPGFTYVAKCSHARVDQQLTATLESASALVTGVIKTAVDSMERSLASTEGQGGCIKQLETIAAPIEETIAAEGAAPDLDAYRRTNYGAEKLIQITSYILAARQNRAACSSSLLKIRENLGLLSELKAKHLDYCKVLRESASYEQVSKLQPLANWVAIDPQLSWDQYFNFNITWSSQCGSFDSGVPGAGQSYAPCSQATVEYQQNLIDLDGSVVGWLTDNRDAIAATTGAIAMALLGAESGAYGGLAGAAIGAAVGLIIGGLDWWMTERALDELDQLIADKEKELKDAVEANFVTKAEFTERVDALCSTWQPVIEGRVQAMLTKLQPAVHAAKIDAYFAESDKLHAWYNELFLWGTAGDPGHRFIDAVTEQELIAQRNAFDLQIFAARTAQEVAAQENELVTQMGKNALLNCEVPSGQRGVQSRLRGNMGFFNNTCRDLMKTIGVSTDAPVPFTQAGTTSDVVCSFNGFRSDAASLEIRQGAGFTSDLTLRDAAGTVIADVTGVSSETPASFPGLECGSALGSAFGTDAGSVLTPGTYPLHLANNLYGFGPADADTVRQFVKGVDSKVRSKAVVCNRQLGMPITLTRTGEACGIPVNF